MFRSSNALGDRVRLRDLMDQHLNLEELKTLCFDLGLDYDNISGDIKRAKVESLILWLGRNDRLSELTELVQESLPDVTWPQTSWVGLDWWQDFPQTTAISPYKDKPQERFEPDLVFVPAGIFFMGSDDHGPEEAPRHEVNLPAFWISRAPISNAQFAAYLRQARQVASSAMLWAGNQPPAGQEQQPTTGVTWTEALAYCSWLSKSTGRAYSLPSEAQWEKAACGPLEVAEPLREWTTTLWGRYANEPDLPYRYPWTTDERDSIEQPTTILRVYRGPQKADGQPLRWSARGGYDPNKPGPRRGRHAFRIMLRAEY